MNPYDYPISTLTSRYVISVQPRTSLREVVRHFVEGAISQVVVVDGESVTGVVSEHDVLDAIHEGADLDQVWACDVMSTDLVSARGDETIADAARRMVSNGVRHLVVFGDESGVVSIRDILAALVE